MGWGFDSAATARNRPRDELARVRWTAYSGGNAFERFGLHFGIPRLGIAMATMPVFLRNDATDLLFLHDLRRFLAVLWSSRGLRFSGALGNVAVGQHPERRSDSRSIRAASSDVFRLLVMISLIFISCLSFVLVGGFCLNVSTVCASSVFLAGAVPLVFGYA